ncbi:MAG: DoxX family protein [Acidobacteriota bacterium]|nr:DoxX family protein [Acidobacteriota bacterium]
MTSATAQNPTARAYRSFSALTGSLASVFLLAIRLYWGWQFAQTGWGKLHHLDKVTSFFTSLGIPAPGFNAVFVALLEFIGGIALALGFGSRFFAFLLAGDMFVAYLTAGRGNLLSIFSDPGKFYGDDAFTFLFASLIVMIFGPGKLALDEFLHRVSKF